MNLDDARTAIIATLGRMNAAYGTTMFDEWVIVSFKPDRGVILSYTGPREAGYKSRFNEDIQPLLAEIAGRTHAVGDFDFAPAAAGTHYDACLRIGDTAYLLCNNIAMTMADIRQTPRWLEAQKVFVSLSEKFQADPVV